MQKSSLCIRYESDDVIWLRNHVSTGILVPNIGCKQTMASNTGGPLTFFFFFFFFLVFTHFSFWLPKAIRRGEISFKSNHVIERNFEAANSRITGTSSGQLYKPCLRGYCTPGPYFWRLCTFSQKIKQLRTKYPMELVRNVPRNSKITVLLQ